MKRILIMGGSYFIGKKIVEVLSRQGYEITVLNRGTRPLPFPGVKQLVCDRNNSEQMKATLASQEFDSVVDVSCMNGEQSRILLEALNPVGLKTLVLISSSAVYQIGRMEPPFFRKGSHW